MHNFYPFIILNIFLPWSPPNAQVSTVLVLFPDGTQVVVPFKEDALLLHLLPKIHKLKRLRLYTNEYVFSVSAADQKHLKVSNLVPACTQNNVVPAVRMFTFLICTCVCYLCFAQLMSPQLDMQQPLRSIGATQLEIHNK